ncbi:hypothetical protein [Streptomyces sp. NPDC005407]|uniref:hypothetical protein n=1 Tax=Streptomyces sp. NPDC005407 TaxID=3155340 RepID=UPI0033AD3640
MPPEQQPQRPGLSTAVATALDAQESPTEAASRAFLDSLDSDAKLYGTAAWDALPEGRRAIVAQRALNAARTTSEQE